MSATPGLERAVDEIDLGTLRNGLGSVKNLELLLKSLKVAPKALYPVVAAVHADCGPLLAASEALEPVLTSMGVDAECARELGSYVTQRVMTLEAALSQVLRGKSLLVAERLRLEGATAQVASDLDAALPLLELLDQVTQPGSRRMTLSELISQYRPEDQPAPRGQRHVIATVAPLSAECESITTVSPKTTMMLASLAVSLVCGDATDLPVHITFGVTSAESATTTIVQRVGPGDALKISTVRPIEPTLGCARAAAHFIGARFDFQPAERLARIAWRVGPGQP
jgi:hypothetical protein